MWDNCSLFVSQTDNLLAPLFIFNQWINWETKRCSSYSRRLHDLHSNHLQVSFVMNYCSCTWSFPTVTWCGKTCGVMIYVGSWSVGRLNNYLFNRTALRVDDKRFYIQSLVLIMPAKYLPPVLPAILLRHWQWFASLYRHCGLYCRHCRSLPPAMPCEVKRESTLQACWWYRLTWPLSLATSVLILEWCRRQNWQLCHR